MSKKADDKGVVKILYTNYRGETNCRKIIPKSLDFMSTEWHPEAQWILTAFDLDKQADRGFAMKDIKEWSDLQ